MNDATNLDRLHDIVVPEPIPWWPPAPGWYFVIATALFGGMFLIYLGWNRWRVNAYRRVALQELETANSVDAISELLRRTALAVWPRTDVAALTGAAWPRWLEATVPIPMSEQVRDQLTRGIYDPRVQTDDLSELKRYAFGWIRQHLCPPENPAARQSR